MLNKDGYEVSIFSQSVNYDPYNSLPFILWKALNKVHANATLSSNRNVESRSNPK